MVARAKTGVTHFATPTDTTVEFSRVVDAPRTLVFAAYTEPRHLKQWLLGMPGWTMQVCEFDPRPGGAWRYMWRKTDGAEMTLNGLVRECTPPERIVTTERWGPEWPETINTVVFTEAAGQTTITTTLAYPSKEARDAAMKTGMRDGLDMSYEWLDALLKKIA